MIYIFWNTNNLEQFQKDLTEKIKRRLVRLDRKTLEKNKSIGTKVG